MKLTPVNKIWIALFLFLNMGCKMEDKTWVDKMLLEMEIAWVKADKAGGGHEMRRKAVEQVAQKYFRPGMSKTDAFKLLKDLELRGFHIGEYRHEGARSWPSGELRPYLDEETKRNLQRQIPPGITRFSARNDEYGRTRLIITKGAAISFTLRDGEEAIEDIRANIWLDTF
jgi:uncharacterized protein YoaH (UPF0181 family)